MYGIKQKNKKIWKIRKRYTNLEITGKYALANGMLKMLEMPGAIREIVVGLPCGAVAGITSSSLPNTSTQQIGALLEMY